MSTDSCSESKTNNISPTTTEESSYLLSNSKSGVFTKKNNEEPYYAWMQAWADTISKPTI